MPNFNRVTDRIAEELSEICGKRYTIYQDADRLEPYSHDEIPGTHYRHFPEIVLRPERTEQISAILRLANREQIPVTPRGAGSGLSGGAVPVYGGIVIAFDRMNKIVELDTENMTITVEPGVIANDINEYLKPHGLFYAGYPMSVEMCQIGGNVAENAGGGKAVKYGVTVRYVLGLETVLPNGRVIELGGKLLKDVTGYNLIPLMTGSEGTLGIFTKIILKVIPRPKFQFDLLAFFPTGREAVAAVPAMITGTGITPVSIEFMDGAAFQEGCRYLNETFQFSGSGGVLLVSVDGNDPERLADECEALGDYLERGGASDIRVADTKANSERVWKLRRSIPEAFSQAFPRQSGEDIVVPSASIPRIVAKCAELARKYEIAIPCYGHAGDGNVHSRICAPASWSDEDWENRLPLILRELYEEVAKEGGRISGEHGIGCKRKPYMETVVSRDYLDTLRAIKTALDPNGIMNPGKIF